MTSPRPLSRAAQRAPAQSRGWRLRPWCVLLVGSARAGVAFSVALHLIDGAGRRIIGLLGVLGVMAGLITMNSMLFMLLLVTRVPVADRVLGRVRTIRWHRLLGRVTAPGVLTHVALILTGTGWTNRDDLTGAVGSLWTGSLPLVFASAALLLLTTIVSVLAVCRGLRRKIRHLPNILSYVAVLLATPHMPRLDPVSLLSRAQRTYWGVLSVSVGACLLWYRILSPLLRSWRYRLELVNTMHLIPDPLYSEFSGRHLDKLETRGGQYFTWRLLTPQLRTQTYRFFLSVAPARDRLCITVRVTDEHTAELAAARPGTRVIFASPYDVLTDASRTRNDLMPIGAGIDLAPTRSLLGVTTAYLADTVVILRASGPENLVLLGELRELYDGRDIALHLMVGPCHEDHWMSLGYAGHDLTMLASDLEDSDMSVCGPGGFIDSVPAEARGLGVSPEQCHEERLTP